MTWLATKNAVLQKLFVNLTADLAASSLEGRDYVAAMPAAANEGLYRLACAGLGPVRCAPVGKRGGQSLCQHISMAQAAPGFYRLEEVWRQGEEQKGPFAGYRWIGPDTLLLPPGEFKLIYRAWHPPITSRTRDEEELELSEGGCALLILYMASALYRDDDFAVAQSYLQQFETGLAFLPGRPASGGFGCFHSESGWV